VINALLKSWKDKVFLKEKKYREMDHNYDNESKTTLR
jgi:hypothetical protein